MKQTEFRGKRVGGGEWVYGDLLHDKDGRPHIVPTGQEFDFDDDMFEIYEVEPATVGQFTGLKDKNGKKIWEGDILEQSFCHFTYSDGEPISGTFTGTVIIRTRGVCMNPCVLRYHDDDEPIKARYKSVTGRRSSIIGNVHDNPELLK